MKADIIIDKILPLYADFAMKTKMYIQLMKSLGFIRKSRKEISSLTSAQKG